MKPSTKSLTMAANNFFNNNFFGNNNNNDPNNFFSQFLGNSAANNANTDDYTKDINISITLEEAYHGVKNKKILLFNKTLYQNDYIVRNDMAVCKRYTREIVGDDLFIPNDIIQTIYLHLHCYTVKCNQCDGTGKTRTTQRMGAMVLQVWLFCIHLFIIYITFYLFLNDYCMQNTVDCPGCKGTKGNKGLIRSIKVTETINIAPGCDKMKVRYKNKIFTVFINWKKHDTISTLEAKQHLFMKMNIDLRRSFLGFNANLIRIKHLNGKYLTINTMKDVVIRNLSYVVLRGYGMPIKSDNGNKEYGDLL